jgi:hypothetical protein
MEMASLLLCSSSYRIIYSSKPSCVAIAIFSGRNYQQQTCVLQDYKNIKILCAVKMHAVKLPFPFHASVSVCVCVRVLSNSGSADNA